MSDRDRPALSFATGERVVFPGHGLGTVEGLDAGDGVRSFAVRMDEGTRIRVPCEAAEAVLQRLPARDEALRWVARLLEPSAPDVGTYEARLQTFLGVVGSRDRAAQVDLLRAMLARGQPPSFGERKQLETLEANVIAVLAEALGEDARTLRERAVLAQRARTRG